MSSVYSMGINLSNHDRSVAICKDGEIICAISEERLDRRKHSDGFYAIQNNSIVVPPLKSITYCLEMLNISVEDLDIIVVGRSIKGCRESAVEFLPIKNKKKIFEFDIPSHHLAHAASVAYSNDIVDGFVIVADEQGHWVNDNEYEYITLYEVKNRNLYLKNKQLGSYDNISFGMFYDIISYCLGFSDSGFPAAGKTMGLSAYGRGTKYNKHFFDISKEGIIFNFENFIEFLYDNDLISLRLNRSDLPLKVANSTILKEIAKYINPIDWENDRAKKIAFIAQQELEFCIEKYLEIHLGNEKGVKLCAAGGIFLNTNLNSRINSLNFINKYYPFPASTDDGCAIGLAYLGAIKLGVKTRGTYTMYLGKKYVDEDIKNSIAQFGLNYEYIREPETLIAEYLNKNNIIGIFTGGSEFGPRALGHRSIIARPDSIEIRDRLNLDIKHRESFRPLAPIVQQEHMKDYFIGVDDSPYMLFVSQVIDKRLKGVTHYDNTARIQTVTQKDNTFIYNILSEFYKYSGLYVCINTSFNVNNDPIVETPNDAINNFLLSDLDFLFMNNFAITKSNIPLKQLEAFRRKVLSNNKEAVLKLLNWNCKNKKFKDALFCFELIRDTEMFNELGEMEYINYISCGISIYNNIDSKMTETYVDKLLAFAYPRFNLSDYYRFKYRSNTTVDKAEVVKQLKLIERMGYVKYIEKSLKQKDIS